MRVTTVTTGCALAALFTSSTAEAQQYSPLTIVPIVNLTLAIDTSHEMALETDGDDYRPGFIGNRLALIRDRMVGGGPDDPQALIYPFRDQFLWSGFAYSGAHFAKIKDGSRVGPFNDVDTIFPPPRTQNPLSIENSYRDVRRMISRVRPDFCNATKGSPACTENVLPGGAALACITQDCLRDRAVMEEVLRGGLDGFTLPTGLDALDFATEIPCTNTGYPTSPSLVPATSGSFSCEDSTPGVAPYAIRPICELAHELSYFSWPRFSPPGISGSEVREEFCVPMEIAFANVQAKLADCVAERPMPLDLTPARAPDAGPGGYRCQHGTISANVCDGSSPFDDTCVCGDAAGCGAAVFDACGVQMQLKARQQIAMCFAHNPNPSASVSPIYNGLRAQDDNTLAPTPGCRGNAIMYLTDGIGGRTRGVGENAPANFGAFRTWDPPTPMGRVPQNYVVEAGGREQADAMADVIQDGAINGVPTGGAIEVRAPGQVRSTLGQIVQRNLRGTYSASNITFDRFETRAAFFLYEVPGGPNIENDIYTSYLGRPSRIAWHAVNDDGTIEPAPLWESDFGSRAGISATGGPTEVIMNFLATGPARDNRIGPGGTWAGGMPKDVYRNTSATDRLDRDGDGDLDVADNTREPVRWGYMLGGENAAPLIIESPREVPVGGTSGAGFARFQAIRAVDERPSTIVAYTNGWIVGLYGGESRTGYSVNNQQIERTYRDDYRGGVRGDPSGLAGRELFRIRPSFIYATDNPSSEVLPFNESLQQPLMNGHMIAREVLMGNNPERFATVLIFMQGSAGRGIAAVDISDPERGNRTIAGDPNSAFAFGTGDGPRPMWEVLLPDPDDRATARPVIYSFPQPKVPAGVIDAVRTTMLVTVGGAGGSSNIYAYRVRDGYLYTQTTLPRSGDESYRTAPSCIDTDGRGASYCYLVRSDGLLVRVPIDRTTGVFGAAVPLSSAMVGGGREFWTEPVVTFDRNNSAVIFAASGNIETLSSNVSNNNAMYKLVDSTFSRASGGIDISNVCSPSSSGSRQGVIAFRNPREMVVSPPVLAKGVLAYTTYLPGGNGCEPGLAQLYTMNYETCADATRSSTNLRPAARDIGEGVPPSPSMMRRVEAIVTHTSKEPTAAQARVSRVNAKAGALLPLQKSYYAPLRPVQ